MSQNSSKKKNSITSLDEYDQLSQLYLTRGIVFSPAAREPDIAVSITKSWRCLENMDELPMDETRRSPS